MSKSSISASEFTELLPSPPYASAAWEPFSLQVVEAPREMTTVFTDHILGLHVSGKHRVRQELDGRTREGRSESGAVNLVPAHLRFSTEANAPVRAIVLFIPEEFVSRVIVEHWEGDPRNVEIMWQFLGRDRVIEDVMTRLAMEAKNGSLSGRLYAESACEFLAHHIVHSYSSMSTVTASPVGGLPPRRLNSVLDYIEESVAQSITLRQLAEVAGVSARHFERAFRQAMGVPPHAYVMERRLATARDLLLSCPNLPIEDIARRAGFSSSSHLASAFRRKIGCTPTLFRQRNTR
jgi:AraC family transcriptional regulator